MSLLVRSVRKSFAFTPVLHDIDLSVDAGQTVVVTGPNGSGKTTFLRCLAGFMRVDSGDISWGGSSVFNRATQKALFRELGVLAQGTTFFYSELSCKENLDLIASFFSDRPGTLVEGALDRVGLLPFQHYRVAELSGGMRVRLAIARLILQEPRFFVLDEPFAQLDRSGVELLESLLASAQARNATIVFSSHRLDIINRFAGRVLALHRGRFVESALEDEPETRGPLQ